MAKKLYTESDVRALARGAELVLGSDAIATPAALDTAFERGVRVVYASKGGGASAPAATTSAPGSSGHKPDCLWHKVLANDGNYVVEVKNGRAQVFALTPNGPLLVGTDSLQTHVGGKS